jgi:hypothetical protein
MLTAVHAIKAHGKSEKSNESHYKACAMVCDGVHLVHRKERRERNKGDEKEKTEEERKKRGERRGEERESVHLVHGHAGGVVI